MPQPNKVPRAGLGTRAAIADLDAHQSQEPNTKSRFYSAYPALKVQPAFV